MKKVTTRVSNRKRNIEEVSSAQSNRAESKSVSKLRNTHELNSSEDNSDSNDDCSANTSERSPSPLPESKYLRARQMLSSCETETLPGREKEINYLIELLTKHTTDNEHSNGSSLYISGQPGTGKTACIAKILNLPIAKVYQQIFINCTSIASIGHIYKKICTELNLHKLFGIRKPANGGSEKDNLQLLEKYLAQSKIKQPILLVLDEIDQLIGKKQSILYTIFEWPSKYKTKILLIGIANSLDLTDRVLPRLNANCSLKPELLHFPPYTKEQIIEIFTSRLNEGGCFEIFSKNTIQLLAAKVAAISGDVRKALDIGRRVIQMTEEHQRQNVTTTNDNMDNLDFDKLQECCNGNDDNVRKVEMKEILDVLRTIYGSSQQKLNDNLENLFPLHQKILICTIMLILKSDNNKDITILRLYSIYSRICKNRNISAVDNSEFVSLCQLVETTGILKIIRKKNFMQNRIQLQWHEDEVFAALRDKQLIASILADKSCLK